MSSLLSAWRLLSKAQVNEFGWRMIEHIDIQPDTSFTLPEREPLRIDDFARFMVPYPRNPHFVGRAHLLDVLRKKLSEQEPQKWNHRVALYGLGGVGKTQLALEYTYTMRAIYDKIYWISAATEADLFSGFQSIAQRIPVPGCINLSPRDVAQHVLRWLRGHDNWLLVIDNLDEVDVVSGYLPDASPTKHTLLTTRHSRYYDIPAEGLEVDIMEINEAVELLLLRSNPGISQRTPGELAECENIVKVLGCLPLAIEQAAGYIREVSNDLYQFLSSYQRNRHRHHGRISKATLGYSESVSTTWRVSFERLERNNSDAIKLMKLLAFLNPDGILVDFLEAGKNGLSPELQEILSDRYRFYEALSELESFSIIRRQPDSSSYIRLKMHRLIQHVVRDELTSDAFAMMIREAIGLCECAFPPWHEWRYSLLMLCRRYHEQVIPAISAIHSVQSKDFGDLLQRVGVSLREDGKYQAARELLERAVEMIRATTGTESPATLTAMAELASTYQHEGRWNDAAELREQVLESSTRLFGEEHPNTMAAMGNLAVTYGDLGRWDDAVSLQERSLEGRSRILGEEHPDTLMMMANLAVTYFDRGGWTEAVILQERVLKAGGRLLGEEHPFTITAVANLAATYHSQGRWADAISLEEKVLGSRRKVLGEEHPDTLTAGANLAVTYYDQGRFADALRLQEKCLDSRRKLLGEEHPDTLTAASNLAVTYMARGQLTEAVTLGEMVLNARIKRIGEKHPDTLVARSNLARAYGQQGMWDEAITEGVKVLEARGR